MPNFYEKYERFHMSYTEEEQQELESAKETEARLLQDPDVQYWEEDGRRGQIDEDKHKLPLPVIHMEIQIAKLKANDQLIQWDTTGAVYPDDPEITDKIPGVDPKGTRCDVDMEFKGRLERLTSALPTRPLGIQSYVGRLLRDRNDVKSPIFAIWDEMSNDCMGIRVNERAAKLTPSREASQWLEHEVESAKKNLASIQRVNGFLNVMEYLSGLTDREPTAQERRLMENLGAEVDPLTERARTMALLPPEEVSVDFPDFDNTIQQKFFSNPLAWEKGPKDTPADVASVEAIAEPLHKYATAAADRTISPLFDQAEKSSYGHVSRGDLITVDGKTIQEMMRERFDLMNPTASQGEYRKWYQENQKRMTNELVSAGLMAGKRVEAFIPDKSGRIPKEPTQITKKGYEPSPLKKVTLNAWERHFAKHGFYKEKSAKAAEYQRVMEARERVQRKNAEALCSTKSINGRAMKEVYFGDWKKEHGELPEKDFSRFEGDVHLTLSRSAYTSLSVCSMLRKGYCLEDIFDNGKLLDVKSQVGRETVDKVAAGEKEWEMETLNEGFAAMNRELNRLGSEIDFSDNKQLFSEKCATFVAASVCAGDIGQEWGHFVDHEAYKDYMDSLGEKMAPGRNGREVLDGIYMESRGANHFATKVQAAMSAMNAEHLDRLGLADLAVWEYMKDYSAKQKAAHPDQQFLNQWHDAPKFAAVNMVLASNQNLAKFSESMEADPVLNGVFRSAARNGELSRLIKVQYDSEKNRSGFAVDQDAVKKAGESWVKKARMQEIGARNTEKLDAKEEKKAPPVKQAPAGPGKRR